MVSLFERVRDSILAEKESPMPLAALVQAFQEMGGPRSPLSQSNGIIWLR